MKYLLMVTGSILLICIVITAVYTPQAPDAAVKEESYIVSPLPSVQNSSVPDTSSAPYRLSVYQKKVAAFQNGKTEPIYISDVYVNSLPSADIALLEKGINADSMKALKRLIEDYCS